MERTNDAAGGCGLAGGKHRLPPAKPTALYCAAPTAYTTPHAWHADLPAAELAGRLHAYRESLHYMMRAGMIPADLLDDVKEVLK